MAMGSGPSEGARGIAYRGSDRNDLRAQTALGQVGEAAWSARAARGRSLSRGRAPDRADPCGKWGFESEGGDVRFSYGPKVSTTSPERRVRLVTEFDLSGGDL